MFASRSHFWHFFLSSHALSPSVIHTPCGRAPLFTPSYTHLCNWNANEARGVWARSSATVWLQWISAKKSPKCQQFTCCRYYHHLNYRKQSRFVIVSWADFSHCNPIQYVYIKRYIMYIFTITKHGWWIFIFSYWTLLRLHSLRGNVCLTLRLSLETCHWRFLNAASAWLEF